jgi:hypothetical protein
MDSERVGIYAMATPPNNLLRSAGRAAIEKAMQCHQAKGVKRFTLVSKKLVSLCIRNVSLRRLPNLMSWFWTSQLSSFNPCKIILFLLSCAAIKEHH